MTALRPIDTINLGRLHKELKPMERKGALQPLDYAAPRKENPRTPQPGHVTLRAARPIGSAIIVLAGAIAEGASAIGSASFTRSDCERWGIFLLVAGLLGFVIEYVASFIRAK